MSALTRAGLWRIRFWIALGFGFLTYDAGLLAAVGVVLILWAHLAVHEKLGHPTEGA